MSCLPQKSLSSCPSAIASLLIFFLPYSIQKVFLMFFLSMLLLHLHLLLVFHLCSDGGLAQSQDDSIVGTKQCRHSVAIMPIPGNLSSSSPDLLQPASSLLDFSNPAGETQTPPLFTLQKFKLNLVSVHRHHSTVIIY